jgi:outer membrane lipase/esterase
VCATAYNVLQPQQYDFGAFIMTAQNVFNKKNLTLPLTTLVVAFLLTSCGGGKQAETFQAQRIIVLGDEASLLTKEGNKYSINAIDATTGQANCQLNMLWVQVVAASYGLTFEECNPNKAPVSGKMLATYGAKAADVSTQIDVYLNTGGVIKNDLVTLMAGTHDVLAQFQANPRPSETDMLLAIDQAGTLVGNHVLKLTTAGAKVLVSTVTDLSLTPLGNQASEADRTLLGRLTTRFNDKLRVRLDADPNGGGRSGALLDENVNGFALNAAINGLGFTNVTQAACTNTAPAPAQVNPVTTNLDDTLLPTQCTTLSANALSSSWLWAGSTQLSGYGHNQLGTQAVLKLRNNPL